MTRWVRSGEVYELTLDQAPCNELNLALLATLEQFVDEVAASDAKALIVHSVRPLGFCAGGDLRQLAERMQGRTPAQYLPEFETIHDRAHALINRFDALSQTTFAALHGVCFGGGFELALTCDVLIADQTTRLAFPELRLGFIPCFGGIPRLRREVPNAVVRDLLFTGRSLNATRAYNLGLISQLVAPGEALSTARSAAREACMFDRTLRAHANANTKPQLLDEVAAEKKLYMRLIAQPRVQAALLDFVSRTDSMPYLPRLEAPPAAEPESNQAAWSEQLARTDNA